MDKNKQITITVDDYLNAATKALDHISKMVEESDTTEKDKAAKILTLTLISGLFSGRLMRNLFDLGDGDLDLDDKGPELSV